MRDPNSAVSKVAAIFVEHMQGIIHQCPYEIGPLRVYNFTETFMQAMDKLDKSEQNLTDVFKGIVYNADIRQKLKLRTDDDPDAYSFMNAYTMKFRRAGFF